LSGHGYDISSYLGAYGRLVLRGLGSEWTAVPAVHGLDEQFALRFVVKGRDRGEFSTFFFDD
jgi:hypothetical protein